MVSIILLLGPILVLGAPVRQTEMIQWSIGQGVIKSRWTPVRNDVAD